MQPCPVKYIHSHANPQSPPGEFISPESIDGGWALSFDAPDGLFQLSIVVDASKFDWESLYHDIDGVRTGPWDFDEHNHNRPLVPSYRVTIDGRYVGIWFFQRVSIDDIAAKRFRGRMACWLQGSGQHTISLVPFSDCETPWLSATLEPDPEDQLKPLPSHLTSASQASPYARWRDMAYWQDVRAQLTGPLSRFRSVFEQSIAAIETRKDERGHALPLLIVAYRYTERPALREMIADRVDQILAMSAYGNPDPEGYSYNCDFDAAKTLHSLCIALLAVPEVLGEVRMQRVRDRLVQQGEIFLELMLLNRDYWGGSVIQDHGWISAFTFASFALNLYGLLPEAERWLRYALPRAERGLDAMPRDGFLPTGSYNSPWQHSDPIALYRESRVAMVGDDPYDRPEVRAFVDGLWHQLMDYDGQQILPGLVHEPLPLVAGGMMYAGLARKYNDPRAQWIADQSVLTPAVDFYHPYMRHAHDETCILLPLLCDPQITPAATTDRQSKALLHYQDSAVALYRDDRQGVQLSMQVGPSSGYHAYERAQGPCDRLAISPTPGDGHFTLTVGGKPLLATPDSGYRLSSSIRTCLLVDDCGQYGDIGYPMSIPSFAYQGQHIESVQQDPVSGVGDIKLNLQPSYPENLGVAAYTRAFYIAENKITVQDHVALSRPAKLSWLFQTKDALGITWESQNAVIGRKLRITPQSPIALHHATHDSPVVYTYASTSGFAKFIHARYDTQKPIDDVTISFEFTWS